MFEGSIIETLLINRLNGTFAGPVDCLVTNDIYSRDGQHSLVPSGTKVLGETKKVEAFGQQRLAIVLASHGRFCPSSDTVRTGLEKSRHGTSWTGFHSS